VSVTFVIPLDQTSPQDLALVRAEVLCDALTDPLAFTLAMEEAGRSWANDSEEGRNARAETGGEFSLRALLPYLDGTLAPYLAKVGIASMSVSQARRGPTAA
jgi:hypothetical protein